MTPGALTARWDYYWQDESYGSFLNSAFDRIYSWGQHNASLTFESANNRWSARLWARNITDEVNEIARLNRRQRVYGEPRIYGISLRWNFGDEGR
jgi:iron complex outermembrane receptor protein